METDFSNTTKYRVGVIRSVESVRSADDNVDVYVYFEDGTSYFATFFTLASIERLIKVWQSTGECDGGRYFWSVNSIITHSLTDDNIEAIVADLIKTSEFRSAFGITQQNAEQGRQLGPPVK